MDYREANIHMICAWQFQGWTFSCWQNTAERLGAVHSEV